MVDITTDRERPRYNAILTVIGLVAQVAITVFVAKAIKKNAIPDFAFVICAAGLLISCAVLLFLVREPKEAREVAARQDAIPWRTYVREVRQFKEAFKLLLSVFFFWTGLNALKPWLSYLPSKLTHATYSQGLIIYAVMIVSALVFAYPYSRLALRYGSRNVIMFGTALLIVAALWGVVIPSYIQFFPLAILAGCGFSATTVLTYPYLMELVPKGRTAAFTGLQTAFSACAVPLAALTVGFLTEHFVFRSVFALLAVLMVIDVLFLASVDDETAKQQIATVEEEERAAIPAGVVAAAPAT